MIFKNMILTVLLASVLSVAPVEEEPIFENPRDYVDVLEPDISEEDLYDLAWLCMAEAEGENEKGKRLVIDTVLNRVDSKSKYLNKGGSIHDVIWEGGYSSMTGSRKDRCKPDDYYFNLVKEELLQRTDYEVLYFRTLHYHNFGTPMFVEDHHYFSK